MDFLIFLKVKHWNLGRYMNMVLEDEWHDDLDVTRVIQTPKIQSFTGQPDIPLESFNPSAHSDAPTSKERKVSVFFEFLCKTNSSNRGEAEI